MRSKTSSIRGCLSAFLLLQLGGAFLPGPGLWAVNHLAYAPDGVRLAWPILGLILVWSPVAGAMGGALTQVGRGFFRRRLLVYGGAPLVAMPIFWLARSANHFLGDGWLLGETVAKGVLFHGYEFITYHLHARLFQWLALSGEQQAYTLFAITSVLMGGAFVAVAGWGARRLTEDPAGRVLIYALMIVSSPLLMFMGYVECYAPLAVALLAFFTSLVLHYQGKLVTRVPALAPAALYGLALFLHLDALFVAPLLLVLIWVPPAEERGSRLKRLAVVGACCLAALLLAGSVYVASGYDRAAYEADFLAGRRAERVFASLLGEQSLLSLTHWKDMGNLLLLLVPMPLGLMLARIRHRPWAREEGVLLAGGLWLVLLMSLVNMKLGVVRDWDLFAAPLLIFAVLAGVRLLPEMQSKLSRPILGAVVSTSLILVLPWIWLNAGEARALHRFRDVITDQSAYSQAYAHEEIGKYLRREGRIEAALKDYRISIELRPHNARRQAVLAGLLYNTGAKEEALEGFQRILAIDPDYPLALEMSARLYVERHAPDLALPLARKLAGRSEETPRAAALHGQAAESANLPRESLEAFERAYALDPQHIEYLERAAGLAFVLGDLKKSEQYFRRTLQINPTSSTAKVGLVMLLWVPIREQPEIWDNPTVQGRLQEALAIIGQFPEGAEDQLLRTWEQGIRTALAKEQR